MADDDFGFGKEEKPQREMTDQLVEYTEFKGNPMIVLKRTPDDKYPFQFGISKAKLVLDNFDAIEAFVEEHKKG